MPFSYTCSTCETEFTRDRRLTSENVFCSRDCYDKHRTPPKLSCEYCGKEFKVPFGHDRKSRKFCSRQCYLESIKADTVSKVCPVCDKTYEVPAVISQRYTVCSQECRTAETVYLVCETCGQSFTGKRNQIRRHCSEECRRPPTYTTCWNCGKEFRYTPSTDRIFCCRYCYRAYQGENRLEKSVRLALERLEIPFLQEHTIGDITVDFAFPDHKTVLEVDSEYWHDPEVDQTRDDFLKSERWHVIRLKENDIKASNDLDQLVYSILKF